MYHLSELLVALSFCSPSSLYLTAVFIGSRNFGTGGTTVLRPAPSLTSSVTLGSSLNFSELQFPPL